MRRWRRSVGSLEAFGVSWHAVVAAAFGCVLVALAGIDLEHFLLPDALTLPALVAGLLISLRAEWITPKQALLAVLGGGALWLLAEAWLLLRHEEGMGLGDVKMLAMIGAFLGWKGVLVAVFLGSLHRRRLAACSSPRAASTSAHACRSASSSPRAPRQRSSPGRRW